MIVLNEVLMDKYIGGWKLQISVGLVIKTSEIFLRHHFEMSVVLVAQSGF